VKTSKDDIDHSEEKTKKEIKSKSDERIRLEKWKIGKKNYP
jgi:hypothetical protein